MRGHGQDTDGTNGAGGSGYAERLSALSIVRDSHDGHPFPGPPAGIGHLDALISEVNGSGLPVELTVTGEPTPLPAASWSQR